ncbi:Aste57867_8089 [Aphanomyces stellatus]|uniref:Aste57867_8089 protein n=1 Tax=Aphanomyces stellatus TaxID=120398 RepID=A0A485KJD3_9STRA|nr:hypothetical protein As57867_008059 [Aphanomyces stellatus]VFT84978.1 Aste57867_8089 [Aphanomyces stellatus]
MSMSVSRRNSHQQTLFPPRDSYPFLLEDPFVYGMDDPHYDDDDDQDAELGPERRHGKSNRVIVVNAKELGGDYVHKGVAYSRRGNKVEMCKFCHIVAACSNEVIYEEEHISVFRPLHPANESHILIVPKQHVRNINHLTGDDLALLVRMKEVAAFVLSQMGFHSFDSDVHLSFHRPPFNSIDHVHMHAMIQDVKGSATRGGKISRMNFVGSVKYSTGTWWCKSYEHVYSSLIKQVDVSTMRSRASTQPPQRGRTRSDIGVSERRRERQA